MVWRPVSGFVRTLFGDSWFLDSLGFLESDLVAFMKFIISLKEALRVLFGLLKMS